MPTYLLAWNPRKWGWDTLAEDARAVRAGRPSLDRWSCQNGHIRPGDRVFLIRLGLEPKGIMGSGTVASERYQSEHYDPERAAAGDVLWRVDVRFDTLLDPARDTLFPRGRLLHDPRFSRMHWDTQSSGIHIHDDVAAHLEAAWAEHTGRDAHLPEEVAEEGLVEGAVRRIAVNAYERNPEARRRCLGHHGARCAVCELDLAQVYGPAGAGVIHVHHLTPLATIGEDYAVDPIHDLRPVCPNCHAIIHRRTPPYRIEEVQAFLAHVAAER